MLASATEHYQRQQRIQAAGLIEAKAARKRGPLATARVVTAYQIIAARDAVASVPLMLAEQGIDATPAATVAVSSLAGVASDGRPLGTLFEQADSDYKFGLMVATQLQDVARIAAALGIVSRPTVTGYVRMLNPPSCSRCAILAGKFFKWNTGFQRHPACDCRHIPSTEALAGDLTTDPKAYFDSLTPAEQAKHFTKAGAQAIRDGADMGQVVNVRSGMSSTGRTETAVRMIDGKPVTVNVSRRTLDTSSIRPKGRGQESTSLTGAAPVIEPGAPDLLAGIQGAQASKTRQAVGRLTPEAIYTSTSSRAQAIALLKQHGYIL